MRIQNSEYRTQNSNPPSPPFTKGGRGGIANSKFRTNNTVQCSLFTDRGFTLIETIIVMVVVAILAAVVILRNPFDSIKLSSATRKVAADIRYVQKLAISNQTRAGITFNLNGYNVYQNIVTSIPATSPGDPCSTNASNQFVVDFNASSCSNYSGIILSYSNATIAFNSLGKPVNSSGGSLTTQTVTVSYKGNDKSITVEEETGRVSY